MRSMSALNRLLLVCLVSVVVGGCGAAAQGAPPVDAQPQPHSRPHGMNWTHGPLPAAEFTHPPKVPHSSTDYFFNLEQLEHFYRVPGEFGHRLVGAEYGFDGLSFILTETHPGGGPALHVHDAEEAHVLLEGTVQYLIGDKTFTVQAPYIAKVPAGVAHTFLNVGDQPFNLVAVFASKRVTSKRLGPNPLVPVSPTR